MSNLRPINKQNVYIVGKQGNTYAKKAEIKLKKET